MFSKSKGDKAKRRQKNTDENRPKPSLSQLGLLEIPTVSDLAIGKMDDDEDDDEDLEAELLALTGGKKYQVNKKARKGVPAKNLDKMVADCMAEDYDMDLDENEPDLEAELSALVEESDDDGEEPNPASHSSSSSGDKCENIVRPSPVLAGYSVVELLQQRIRMYTQAEENALAQGDTARAKRFSRGLKTLNQQLRSVKGGKAINEEEIPPTVLTTSSRSNSTRNLAQQQGTEREDSATIPQTIAFQQSHSEGGASYPDGEKPLSSILSSISSRQLEYKMAALNAKKRGDKESAIHLMRVAKQMDPLVQAAKEGNEVDLGSLPPSPSVAGDPSEDSSISLCSNDTLLGAGETEAAPSNTPPTPQPAPVQPQAPPPAVPSSVLEALEQRLAKYTEQRDKAKEESNSRKERMNTRIMKQYQDAIRMHKMGRFVEFEELPSPPGFAPIPKGPSPAGPVAPLPTPDMAPEQKPLPKPTPVEVPTKPVPEGVKPQVAEKTNVRKAPQSRVERQFSVLKRRQTQFKEAALDAKKKGEIEQAKEYLRNYKGFDQLIMATSGGLPVDMNTVPIPPQEKLESESASLDFELVEKDDCIVSPPSTSTDVALSFTKLEEDLIAQIKMCATTRQHFKALGDVASANRFEQLILHSKKDLDAVRVAFKRGDQPPRFHYENRTFTIIQCNTDLTDSDCEVTILRGINFNVSNPTDVDTCVKIEFPYPSDAPPQERSCVVKDTNNPEFNHKVIFSIDRKARALARVFKRHTIKCQIVAKGGWFHRDSVIGTAKIPLVPLETKCTLHESFDLLDERKKMIGGKLEVKIRVRNPILSKQLEQVNEKWVVIAGF